MDGVLPAVDAAADSPVPAAIRAGVADAVDFLLACAGDRVEPAEARRRVATLKAGHPGLGFELVWEREAFDGSYHYDVLLAAPGLGTVSVALSPEQGLPWLLRGAVRADDRALVRVDSVVMEVDRAVACLDILWDEARLMDRLVDACILQAVLDADPVDLSDAELQEAMDGFRRAKGLHTVAATVAWMAQRGMTHRDLEELVAGEAAIARLRQAVTAPLIEEAMALRAAEFDRVRLARLWLDDEDAAIHLAGRLRAGEEEFYAAAERAFLAERTGQARPFDARSAAASGLFQDLSRRDLSDPLAALLSSAVPGDIVGPLPDGDRWLTVKLVAVEPADPGTLDERTRDAISRQLFREWLANRRREARIEWFWGTAARTATSVTDGTGR